MKQVLTALLAVFGVAFAAAPAATDLLPAGTWNLATINGEAPTWENVEIFFTVAADGAQVNGKAGCNNFNGRVSEVASNVVTFGNLAATMMFCPGDGSDAERLFFEFYATNLTVTHVGNELTLFNDETSVTYALAQ